MAGDHGDRLVKAYDLWDLHLHTEQSPYIGRCYAWAKREDAGFVTNMTHEEREELFSEIVPEWEKAMEDCFGMDIPNVACLGNRTSHLHWHLIPRYNNPVSFEGVEFVDPRPKGNYAPFEKRELSEAVFDSIKMKVRDAFVGL